MNKTEFQKLAEQYVNAPYVRQEAERDLRHADAHRDCANQIEKFDPEAAGIMRAAAEGYSEIAAKQIKLVEHFKACLERDVDSSLNRVTAQLVSYKR